jgi:hypothetical protein
MVRKGATAGAVHDAGSAVYLGAACVQNTRNTSNTTYRWIPANCEKAQFIIDLARTRKDVMFAHVGRGIRTKEIGREASRWE